MPHGGAPVASCKHKSRASTSIFVGHACKSRRQVNHNSARVCSLHKFCTLLYTSGKLLFFKGATTSRLHHEPKSALGAWGRDPLGVSFGQGHPHWRYLPATIATGFAATVVNGTGKFSWLFVLKLCLVSLSWALVLDLFVGSLPWTCLGSLSWAFVLDLFVGPLSWTFVLQAEMSALLLSGRADK